MNIVIGVSESQSWHLLEDLVLPTVLNSAESITNSSDNQFIQFLDEAAQEKQVSDTDLTDI